MLIYHQYSHVAFIWEQFHRNCSRYQSLTQAAIFVQASKLSNGNNTTTYFPKSDPWGNCEELAAYTVNPLKSRVAKATTSQFENYIREEFKISHWFARNNEDMPHIHFQTPGPCLTTATWRCRKNFSQWERSFHWKLRCHWLEFLRQRQIAVVRQGPAFVIHVWVSSMNDSISHKISHGCVSQWLYYQFSVSVINLPISFKVTSLALGQSCDCPSASDVTLNDMG